MSEKSLDNLITVCNRYKQNEFDFRIRFESSAGEMDKTSRLT